MMTNAELIKALRYCAEHDGCDYYIAKDCPRESTWVCGADCEQILMHAAAAALEAADKRIDGLQKLVDINTERCEALRKQLREAHESYEQRIAELEKRTKLPDRQEFLAKGSFVEEPLSRPKEGEWQWLSSTYDRVPCEMMYVCSVCHHQEITHYDKPWKHYCPNCGAKMKGEQE